MKTYNVAIAPDVQAEPGEELYGILLSGRRHFDKAGAIRDARTVAKIMMVTTYVLDDDAIVVAGPF